MEYRCVQCGLQIKTIFEKLYYESGLPHQVDDFHWMDVVNCKAGADEYIECELMIALIDLILHKPKAYRHVIFNVLNNETSHFQCLLWKSLVGFLVLDTCSLALKDRSLLFKKPEEEWGTSMSIYSFFWIYRKNLVDVFMGTICFYVPFFLQSGACLRHKLDSPGSEICWLQF